MTKDEFRTQLEQFWAWTSQRDRSEASWWLSMAGYAQAEFIRASDEERRSQKV